eukprot:1184254-Prorocentrum_minimum.AAC.9
MSDADVQRIQVTTRRGARSRGTLIWQESAPLLWFRGDPQNQSEVTLSNTITSFYGSSRANDGKGALAQYDEDNSGSLDLAEFVKMGRAELRIADKMAAYQAAFERVSSKRLNTNSKIFEKY